MANLQLESVAADCHKTERKEKHHIYEWIINGVEITKVWTLQGMER